MALTRREFLDLNIYQINQLRLLQDLEGIVGRGCSGIRSKGLERVGIVLPAVRKQGR